MTYLSNILKSKQVFHFTEPQFNIFSTSVEKKIQNISSCVHCKSCTCGRHGGLMVSMLDTGSKGPGSSLDWVIVLCSWARHFTLTVPLSTQEYKWVSANCQGNQTKCWGVLCTYNGLASHPGGVVILLVSSCYRNLDELQQCGPLGLCARLFI